MDTVLLFALTHAPSNTTNITVTVTVLSTYSSSRPHYCVCVHRHPDVCTYSKISAIFWQMKVNIPVHRAQPPSLICFQIKENTKPHHQKKSKGTIVIWSQLSTADTSFYIAAIWTSNLLITSRPALPAELQPPRSFHRSAFKWGRSDGGLSGRWLNISHPSALFLKMFPHLVLSL